MGITLNMVLASFGGGLFGAAIGGNFAFIFTGLLVLVGEALAMSGSAGDITNVVAFGMMFGPHIAFAGGAAATAYAAKKERLEDGKNVGKPLIGISKNWDILFIGGLFGVFGMTVNQLLGSIGAPTDTVALTVFISAIVHRIMFGETGIFGTYNSDKGSSFWNPSAENAWLPSQTNFSQLLMIGLGVGLIGGYIGLKTTVFIPFGIAAVSLIVLQTMGEGPVTHHIAFPAAVAAVATGNIIWGGIFGILGAFLGEFYARLCYVWGDTHIDPPAAAIATTVTAAIFFLGFSF
ncbi:hypothetical protein C7954_1291 [Halanaerobium congolense]|uniref:DUF7973 domain-containing protein n=1 Tax=Halanaerobium congolense TaxID=54121 RepID=A0A4R8GFW4_9FIRM|nr:hypothetical protein [Halanaerobium congolense]TDX40305.1 hypothetical protein C7954_1291 [Halanaerobium congolense]